MHSDLLERAQIARENIHVAPFPLDAIRAATSRSAQRPHWRRWPMVALVASLSLVAMGAAGEVVSQTHVHFTPTGGMVIASDAKTGSRPISSTSEVREAAAHLNFAAVLPAGLPDGTTPVRLYTSGSDLMAVTYNLPGAWRASHHLLWIFLANPQTLGSQELHAPAYQLRPDSRMLRAQWRAGAEEVIVVSNGLTQTELQTIKRAMK